MKRAIIGLTLVVTLMLSVVACQIYNPTDNSTIYTAMRTEGATSWADYSKKFEDANGDQKYETLMEYEAFRKMETNTDYPWKNKAEWIALYDGLRPAYDAAKKVVDAAGSKASQAQKDALEVATAPLTKIYGSVEGLKALWDKEYDVLWDFNGKL